MNQILYISFRSFDRRKIKSTQIETDRHSIIHNFLNHFPVCALFSYDTFFSYFFPSCLKLRFNKSYDLTVLSEINETSIEEKSISSPKSSGVTYRIFVFSMQITLGSFLSFQSSCPRPTSIANTFFAPF